MKFFYRIENSGGTFFELARPDCDFVGYGGERSDTGFTGRIQGQTVQVYLEGTGVGAGVG